MITAKNTLVKRRAVNLRAGSLRSRARKNDGRTAATASKARASGGKRAAEGPLNVKGTGYTVDLNARGDSGAPLHARGT